MILHRALDAIMPAYRELFARYDLTEQQWRILRVLWSSQKVTSIELSNRTLLPPPSLVGIIDRLEKKGLVSRLRSVEDRRVVYVQPTASGRELEKKVAPQVTAIHARIREAVSVDAWCAMEDTLQQIGDAMARGETGNTAVK